MNKKTPIQKHIEYQVTNGLGYDTSIPIPQSRIKFREILGTMISIATSKNPQPPETLEYKAHLAHLEYKVLRPFVFPYTQKLKKIEKDEKTDKNTQRETRKLRKGILNLMSYYRRERDALCREICNREYVFSVLEEAICSLNTTQRITEKLYYGEC